jgi:hypothetical protein
MNEPNQMLTDMDFKFFGHWFNDPSTRSHVRMS